MRKKQVFLFFLCKIDVIIVVAQLKIVFKELPIAKFKEIAFLLEVFYLPD